MYRRINVSMGLLNTYDLSFKVILGVDKLRYFTIMQ
jgi:hypothetical protein